MTLSLSPQRAALLVIDVQERLAAAMSTTVMATVERNVISLIKGATKLGLPVVISEQYPKGLGRTLATLEDALTGSVAHRFDKVEFSVCGVDGFAEVKTTLGPQRDQWLVCGMETHVCVFQTVRDLVDDAAVHVISDAVASRAKHNWRIGLALAEQCGAIVSSTETALFDLLGRAGGEDFKAISRLVK